MFEFLNFKDDVICHLKIEKYPIYGTCTCFDKCTVLNFPCWIIQMYKKSCTLGNTHVDYKSYMYMYIHSYAAHVHVHYYLGHVTAITPSHRLQ